ncbi:MAG: SMP-30/gluconolactonase/LRE family protein [Methylophilaceae bacterium]
MLKILSTSISIALLTAGCATESNPPMAATQEVVMQKVTGLKTLESAIQAKDGRIFVSEINEFGKDGDGQIALIDKTGKTSVFASGLDDPKGLAMIADDLYVADKNKVIKITPEGKTSLFANAEAFSAALKGAPIFLNDLASDPQGNLYVSDSGDIFGTGLGGAIFKITPQGQVSLVVSALQEPRIKSPNGLLTDATGNVLTVVDFSSGVLYSINQKSKVISQVAEGFGGGDGLVHRTNGTMYVSDWKTGKVYSVNTKGAVSLLKEGYQSAADIALTQDEKYLMVPDMKAGELDFIPLQ